MAVTTKAALLQALIEGEAYGLALIARVKERTNGGVVLHQGSIYPALRELEREGFVTARAGEPLPERGGRPRIYYQLTAEGVRQARADQGVVIGLFGLPILQGT